MADYRDWAKTLRRASYRGVPFFIETEELETGRRLHVHEFPFKDDPYVEDLGRKTNVIAITAYVVGDAIEAAETAVRQACEQGGAATLLTPIGRWEAHCEECKRSRARDKQGYIAFSLKFVRTGTGAAPFSLLTFARAVEFGADSMLTPLSDAFGRTFQAIGFPGFVAGAAAATVRGALALFQASVKQAPVAPADLAGVLRSITDAFNAADTLVLSGATGDSYTTTSFISANRSVSASPLAAAIVGLFSAAAKALEPAYAAEFLKPWCAWDVALSAGYGASTAQVNANELAIQNLVRAAALARYASALVQISYPDPRVARQARADAAEFFDYHLTQLAGWENYAVWTQLADLRGKVVQHLSLLITTLAPVVLVQAPRNLPSLWWANRLYGDASRSGELAQRNGVKHPLFMPAEFEALAK